MSENTKAPEPIQDELTGEIMRIIGGWDLTTGEAILAVARDIRSLIATREAAHAEELRKVREELRETREARESNWLLREKGFAAERDKLRAQLEAAKAELENRGELVKMRDIIEKHLASIPAQGSGTGEREKLAIIENVLANPVDPVTDLRHIYEAMGSPDHPAQPPTTGEAPAERRPQVGDTAEGERHRLADLFGRAANKMFSTAEPEYPSNLLDVIVAWLIGYELRGRYAAIEECFRAAIAKAEAELAEESKASGSKPKAPAPQPSAETQPGCMLGPCKLCEGNGAGCSGPEKAAAPNPQGELECMIAEWATPPTCVTVGLRPILAAIVSAIGDLRHKHDCLAVDFGRHAQQGPRWSEDTVSAARAIRKAWEAYQDGQHDVRTVDLFCACLARDILAQAEGRR